MNPFTNKIRPRLAIVVTSALSTGFFSGQAGFLIRNGFEVDLISSPGPQLEAMRGEGANIWPLPIEREMAPGRDLVSLWRLWRRFRHTRPDMVIAATPKAGLLGVLGARMAGVPCVAYMALGLRLETAPGWKRRILWLTERLSSMAADAVLPVSQSLRSRMIELGLARPEKCRVPGNGTVNGIDTAHWRRTPETIAAGRRTREALGIPASAPVIGFMGRLVHDKGIADLYEAFLRLRRADPALRLLLVGDFEEGDPVAPEMRAQLRMDEAVTITGFVSDAAPYYWAMDVLALPTYREGFPGAPLEAQAASVPVVTTNATGAVDSIIDGVTGICVPPGDVDELTAALGKLLGDTKLRMRMGEAGRRWVEENFERAAAWRSLLGEYRAILQTNSSNRAFLRASRRIELCLKAGLDRILAALLLIATLPLWLSAAAAVRGSVGKPVLFRQQRPGLKGRPFTLLKFRTMRQASDAAGAPLPDSERLTAMGKLLRAASLDELPQLWNVLRGDMSLVGPRPLLMSYLDRYTPEQARRHEVKPGITGWAQVNGRNDLGWEQKFALDLWYVEHRSLALDAKILWLTLVKVFARQGISRSGHATMPEFLGSAGATTTHE